MEQKFLSSKLLKTPHKVNHNNSKMSDESSKTDLTSEKIPLSTQNAVKFLLEGSLRLRVCRYCLSVTTELSDLDEVLVIALNGSLHEVAIKDMVASFHPFKVSEDENFPNKICKECLDRTMNCYLFTMQCEQAERALRNCFDDMYEKFEKLDSLEPVKKRGKRKLHPNYNILYAEHEIVMDYSEPIINIVNTDSLPNDDNNIISELECQKCWQVLPNIELLINHENSHPKSMWYNCRLCGKSFVKRYQLRKHIKKFHRFADEEQHDMTNMSDFNCNECGMFNKTLSEHLQHIEKHKFKETFKNLIERKVDNLCSVCLDKGSKMVNMTEIVCLHGGYPNLVGDKTIYDILSATLPGQNPSKYRELLVATEANIIKITRKNLASHTDYQHGSIVMEEPEVKKPKLNFIFSPSILVESNSLYFKDFSNSFMYTFSEPEFLELKVFGVSEYNDDSIAIIDFNSDNDKKDSIEITDNKGTAATNDTKIDEIIKECKKCWVFEKLNCKKCIELSKAIEKSDVPKEIEDKSDFKIEEVKCDLCWMFAKTQKCDYCGKQSEISHIKEMDDEPNENMQTKEIKETNNFQYKSTVKEEKSDWQCNICLTTNVKNTQICICCDESNDKKDKLKVNFGTNTSFNLKDNHTSDKKEAIITISDNNIDEYSTKQAFSFLPNNNVAESSTLLLNSSDETHKIEDFLMEIETLPENIDKNKIITQLYTCNKLKVDHEEMDVTFEEDYNKPIKKDYNKQFENINIPTVSSNIEQICNIHSNATFQPKPFTFNLGSGVIDRNKGRHYKKPLRRMAHAFPK